MSDLWLNPETYVQAGDQISVMYRSMRLDCFQGTVLEIGTGDYGYRAFIIQKEGSEFGKADAIGVVENQAVFSVCRGDCWVSVPLPMVLEEAAEKEKRRLVNERKRAEKKVPLFADQINIAEPDADGMVSRFNHEGGSKLARDHAEAMQSNELRAKVESLCSPEDFAHLAGRRNSFPKDGLYGKTFWRKHLVYIQEHGAIDRLTFPTNIREKLNLPWLKLDSQLIWKTAPGGPQPVRVLFIGSETVMVRLTGEPIKDFNPRDFPESRNVWIKPDEFAVDDVASGLSGSCTQ